MHHLTRSLLVVALWAAISQVVLSQEAPAGELSVLSGKLGDGPAHQMMRRYLREQVREAVGRRRTQYEDVKTPDQAAAYQERLRASFVESLGGFPERTPLNARVVGRGSGDGYRFEKILYESQPHFFVSAILYLPDSKPPYPGVLVPCGHSATGKAADAYQSVSILLARHGMAALCFDPIGQGERRQVLASDTAPLGPTSEHNLEGIAPILLGRSLASYMIWDGIRGIDYLCSRPDIAPDRIGCTGNSGGGNQTSYLMALDDRIQCAAPSCFITTSARKNESPGPGDMEQNIFGQIAYGMDHADYLLMRAPKPTLICSATRDFVPIEGAWESFRDAKRWYTRLGHAERADLIEAGETHGFSPLLRVGATRWMRRWLLQQDDAITELPCEVASVEQLQCTPTGQVLRMEGARSVFDLNIEEESRLRVQRQKQWNDNDDRTMLEEVRRVTRIPNLADIPALRSETVGQIQCQGYVIEKLALHEEEGIVLPSLLFKPENATGQLYLYVSGDGMQIDSRAGGPVEKLVMARHTVMMMDIRGCGETQAVPWRYGRDVNVMGRNAPDVIVAYMLGRSFLGMRTADILAGARFLRESSGNPQASQLHLIALGEAGPPALHAAALERELFTSLTLQRSLVSWADVIHTAATVNQLVNVVHGSLRVYDLPDLVASLPEERVSVETPLDAAGQEIAD